jgi:hypothetical protein
LGLSIPLDGFGFHIADAGNISISFSATCADDPARWRFWQLLQSTNYLLAVCAERFDETPQRLVVRKIVPLRTEEIIPSNIVGQSAVIATVQRVMEEPEILR